MLSSALQRGALPAATRHRLHEDAARMGLSTWDASRGLLPVA